MGYVVVASFSNLPPAVYVVTAQVDVTSGDYPKAVAGCHLNQLNLPAVYTQLRWSYVTLTEPGDTATLTVHSVTDPGITAIELVCHWVVGQPGFANPTISALPVTNLIKRGFAWPPQ